MKDTFNLGITPMPPILIIDKLSSLKTKSSKLRLLKQAWDSDSESFFIGIQISLDNNVDFMQENVPAWDDNDDVSESLNFEDFYNFYLKTKSGEYTKEEAKTKILELANKAGSREWNEFYRKILLKRLHYDLPMDIITTLFKQIADENKKKLKQNVSVTLTKRK